MVWASLAAAANHPWTFRPEGVGEVSVVPAEVIDAKTGAEESLFVFPVAQGVVVTASETPDISLTSSTWMAQELGTCRCPLP